MTLDQSNYVFGINYNVFGILKEQYWTEAKAFHTEMVGCGSAHLQEGSSNEPDRHTCAACANQRRSMVREHQVSYCCVTAGLK